MQIDTTKITVVIAGHFVKNYNKYIQYLLHSMNGELSTSKYLIYYDQTSMTGDKEEHLQTLKSIMDKYSIKNYEIKIQRGGLLSVFYNMIKDVSTPYLMFLEHDWVFLEKPNYSGIVQEMDRCDFVKCVKFKKMGNVLHQLNSTRDYQGKELPFIEDDRVKEVPLIQVCYWSNNPFIARIKTIEEWSKHFLTNSMIEQIKNNSMHGGAIGIEETLIPLYEKDVATNPWESIKDKWGVFIYGRVGMKPIIGHTDGSQRYNGMPEQLGKEWIQNYYKE